jgi:hypothetical protein
VPSIAQALTSASNNSRVDANGSALAPTATPTLSTASVAKGTEIVRSTVATTSTATSTGATISLDSSDYDLAWGGDDYWPETSVLAPRAAQSADLSVVLKDLRLAPQPEPGDSTSALLSMGRITRSRCQGSQLPSDSARETVAQVKEFCPKQSCKTPSAAPAPTRAVVPQSDPVPTTDAPAGGATSMRALGLDIAGSGRTAATTMRKSRSTGNATKKTTAAAATGVTAPTLITQVLGSVSDILPTARSVDF